MRFYPGSFGTATREANPCHEPGGSEKGGQFARKGSCDASQKPTASSPSSGRTPAFDSLATKGVESVHPLGGGTSATYVVELEDGTHAVYKPETGERWNKSGWANEDIGDAIIPDKEFSQAAREAAAYDLDQILGTGLVPETVHRPDLDVDVSDVSGDDEHGYTEDELADMYNEYKDGEQDRAGELANEAMFEKYTEARDEAISDLKGDVDKVYDLWDEVVDELGTDAWALDRYGDHINKHPTLPLGNEGSAGAYVFSPRKVRRRLDPLDVLAEIGYDFDDLGMVQGDRARVKKWLLENATQFDEIGDFDEEDAAKRAGFAEYNEWVQDLQSTHRQVMDSVLPSFNSWVQNAGYEIRSGPRRLDEAGSGSLQRLIPDPRRGGINGIDFDTGARFAALDYALGSMDRHGGNYIQSGLTGQWYAIDNGFSFPNQTGIQYRSGPTADFLRWVRNQRNSRLKDDSDAILKRIGANLTEDAVESFLKRYPKMPAGSKSAFRDRASQLREALTETDSPTQSLADLWTGERLM